MSRVVNDELLEAALLEQPGWTMATWFSYKSIPCEHQMPELDCLERDFKLMMFYRINADDHPTLCAEKNIHGVPTTILFKNGDEVARFEGPYSRERLTQDVKAHMKKSPL